MKKPLIFLKPIVFIDMDEVLCDFTKAAQTKEKCPATLFEPGFFKSLEPVPGALRGVRRLLKAGLRVEILTQPEANSILSYSEKAQWILMWLPELKNHITMTQDKLLLSSEDGSRFLIDDNKYKWGEFNHFEWFHAKNCRSLYPKEEAENGFFDGTFDPLTPSQQEELWEDIVNRILSEIHF